MKGKTILVIVLILALIGTLTFFYLKYEKPAREEARNDFNVSIYAIDSVTQDKLATTFDIYVGGVLQENDTTLKMGAVLKKFEAGSSVVVKSTNHTYYNDEIFANPDILNLSRVELRLVKPSPLEIEEYGSFLLDNKITYNLSTRKEFRNLIVCANWSNNFVYVKSNYPQISENSDKPLIFDKCFETKETLNKTNNVTFELSYKVWGFLSDEDYISLYFMDSENGISDFNEEKDYWATNQRRTLNINNI